MTMYVKVQIVALLSYISRKLNIRYISFHLVLGCGKTVQIYLPSESPSPFNIALRIVISLRRFSYIESILKLVLIATNIWNIVL